MRGSDVPLVLVPRELVPIVEALAIISAKPLPPYALIGGMAVNIRLAAAGPLHRATADVDLVVDDGVPTAAQILTGGGPEAIVIDGVKVDIIQTEPLTDEDLDGLNDGPALFVAGHRFALATARPLRLSTAGGRAVMLPVATPAGLVAAKSHALGYARAQRRQTKGPGDHYDVFRLLEVFDARGDVRTALGAAPDRLRHIIADVLTASILRAPARAAATMRVPAGHVIEAAHVFDVIEPVADALR